jgi:hypothetical protein
MDTFIPLPAPSAEEPLDVDPAALDLPPDFCQHPRLLVGLVLDLSPQHHRDSRRYLDIIKAQLVEVIVSLGESDDRVYIYHPDQQDIPAHQGVTIARLMDYETPAPFGECAAIGYTLALLAQQDEPVRRKFIYLTDRNRAANLSEMALAVGGVKGHGCEMHLVGVGDKYNPAIRGLPLIAHHLDDPYQLAATLRGIFGG